MKKLFEFKSLALGDIPVDWKPHLIFQINAGIVVILVATSRRPGLGSIFEIQGVREFFARVTVILWDKGLGSHCWSTGFWSSLKVISIIKAFILRLCKNIRITLDFLVKVIFGRAPKLGNWSRRLMGWDVSPHTLGVDTMVLKFITAH